MRWIYTATCAGLLALGATGCNQNDAAMAAEIATLKAQQEQALRAQDGKGQSDQMALLIASMNKGGDSEALERKMTSLREDIRSDIADLKTNLKSGQLDSESSLKLLEDRMDKVTELQASIVSLKTMIESLETKVKNVDPAETLAIQRDLLTKEVELKTEVAKTKSLEESISEAKIASDELEAEVASLKEQIEGLEGDDISKHPMYKKMKSEFRDLKSDNRVLEADRDLWRKKHDELLKQIGDGTAEGPKVENPVGADAKVYDFRGKVLQVTSGSRPGGDSSVLLNIASGTVPPIGAELLVLDEKNKPVCHIRVTSHFHVGQDSSMPVEQIGGKTINESPSKPVTKGDTVVWNKPVSDDE
ncbi:MAG: hypothetical protein L3J82_01070 [Planctomycetes bacterium]|nr:hypothetical protein [Planctomycetota bacterium]